MRDVPASNHEYVRLSWLPHVPWKSNATQSCCDASRKVAVILKNGLTSQDRNQHAAFKGKAQLVPLHENLSFGWHLAAFKTLTNIYRYRVHPSALTWICPGDRVLFCFLTRFHQTFSSWGQGYDSAFSHVYFSQFNFNVSVTESESFGLCVTNSLWTILLKPA